MLKLRQSELLLSEGKISRREFMTRVSALGLTAALSPALFASQVRAATPKKGGRLKLAMSGGATSDTLNPQTTYDQVGIAITWTLKNCLAELDYKGRAVPELAVSWEAAPGAAKWIVKLRKNVEFHNGKTMEAQDVIDSINLHRGKESKSAAKTIVDQIADIKADGKHSVIFELNAGNADFPYILCDYHLCIQPAGTQGAAFEKGIGTGPYVLKKYSPGNTALMKRNPNYWKEGRAHFDEVEFLYVSDVNARTSAIMSRKVDVMNSCDVKTAPLLDKAPHIKVYNVAGTRHFSIPMLCDKAPYDDNNVRMALKHAVDREDLVKRILRGYGEVGNDIPIGKNQNYFAADIPQRSYNPDKAKFYMQKTGLKDHTFKLHASDIAFAGAVDAAVLIKEHAAKAGINIEIIREPADGYWEKCWGKCDWIMSYWAGRATCDWMFTTAYEAGAAWNETHWNNKRFNELLKAGRAELDKKKRAVIYAEMQQLVRDDGGALIPMFANWVFAVNSKLQIENPAGQWDLDGLRGTERWWFA